MAWEGSAGSIREVLLTLATFYNKAMVSTEATGPGYATIGAMMALNYPYIWQNRWAEKMPGQVKDEYGFQTNMKTKNWLVGVLVDAVCQRTITIHDSVTYAEMLDYVALDPVGYGNASKQGFDDTVTSLGITVLCHMTEPALSPYGTMGGGNMDDENTRIWDTWQQSQHVQHTNTHEGVA